MLYSTLLAAGGLVSVVTALPTLNPRAPDGRLVIYWGAEDDSTTLDDVCNDDAYSIVNLAFLDKFVADGGYPQISIAGLWDSTQAQQDAGATGLKDGSPIVEAIKSCQSKGKLVILSLGGWEAAVQLEDDDQAVEVADKIWNLFGGGTETADLRPFGEVKLDGFDFDNESGNPTGYNVLASQFRKNFATDTSKKYYLTTAPQCPFPDASQPPDVCAQMDYVWVQFYNNGECNIGKSNFINAVKTWSENIGDAQLFIGAIASDADGDQGYVSAEALVESINNVKDLNLGNYGGAMLWEAQLAVKNNNYQKAVKSAV